jgi:6-phosphogluconolactonase
MAEDTWLQRVDMLQGNVHAIPAELGAQAAAQAYAQSLKGVGDFDLVLLGLGEDAHTASLFPGHDWGEGADAPDALAVFDAPKPPPERVSLSAQRLSRARQVLFLVTGAGKREAITAWRKGERIPAAAIRPAAGVDVLMDWDAVPQGD